MSRMSTNETTNVKNGVLQYKPTNFIQWLPLMQLKAEKEHGEVGQEIRNMKRTKYRTPAKPTETDGKAPDKYDDDNYREEMKAWRLKKDQLKEKQVKLFALVMESVSSTSRTVIENDPRFTEALQESNLVVLMTIITETHQPHAGLEKTQRLNKLKRDMIAYRQQKNQSTLDYCIFWREEERTAKRLGLDMSDQEFWVDVFFTGLGSHMKGYLSSRLDPTRNQGDVPTTLTDAILMIEQHVNFNRDFHLTQENDRQNRSGPSNGQAVVANTTVNKPGASKKKGKSDGKGGKAVYCQPTGGSTAGVRPTRPDCPHCKKKNPNHDAKDCFSLPENAQKKQQMYDKRKGSAASHATTLLVNALGDLLMNLQQKA